MGQRPYDVVLLGATGFTGRLTGEHLARRLAGTRHRWAVAGRNRSKLEAVREQHAQIGSEPDVEVVDAGDLVGLLEVAERTQVLATTVGPYLPQGELTVQACIRSGTHYCDITGEPAFVDRLLARYDGDARRQDVKIVNCCGIDSIPHDLGARYTVEQLPDDVPITLRGFLRAKGRPSGGTWQTLLGIAAQASPSTLRGPSLPPDGGRRRVSSLPPRIVRDRVIGAVGVPLPTIDPAVVLRSAQVLPEYGPDFRYGHYLHLKGPAAAAGLVAGGGLFAALAKTKPTRALLRKLMSPGEGPSEEQRAASWFTVTFHGEGGGREVVTRVSGGDPGYGETAKMLGETALSLALDPLPDRSGVVTTAVAGGAALQRRLEDQGMRFEVC